MKKIIILSCVFIFNSCHNHYLKIDKSCTCRFNAQAQVEFDKLIGTCEAYIYSGKANTATAQAVSELERITSVQSEFILTSLGKLPTNKDIKNWKNWFKYHKYCLEWNEINKKLSLCN